MAKDKKAMVHQINANAKKFGLRTISVDTEDYAGMMKKGASKLIDDLTNFELELQKALVLIDLGLDNGVINDTIQAIEEEKASLSQMVGRVQQKVERVEQLDADMALQLSNFYSEISEEGK